MSAYYIRLFGLLSNFIGTLFLIFYISVDKNEWVEDQDGQKPGEKWFAVLIKYPNFLKAGIMLISFGFLLSIVGEVISQK